MKKKAKKPVNKKRRIIVSACAAGLALVIGITAACTFIRVPGYYLSVQKEAPVSTPAATGSFLQPWYCANWSEEQFAGHFRAMKEIGADTLVLQWTADTPEGKIREIFYDSALPEELFEENAARYPDMLENCLAAAEAEGIKVFIGLNSADEWWSFAVRKADWRERQSTVSAGMIREIHALYKEKYPNAFHGWYWSWELTNGFLGINAAADLINRDIAAMNETDSTLPLMLSPFYSKNSPYKIAEQEWKRFFAKANFRQGDIFCQQDAIGAGWIGMDDLDYYYAALKRAVDTKPELVFWANCENFTQDYLPADAQRFKQQLDTAAKYTDGIISFSLSHYYLNPDFGDQPLEDYKKIIGLE